MARSLETDELFLDCPTATASKLNMWKPQTAQISAEAKMAKRNVRMAIDMHPLSAFTPAFTFRQVKISLKAVNCSSGYCFSDDGFRVMEAKQTGRDLEEFR
jgi:hypothetical protein